jgi:hypothetical protein
MEGNDRRVHLMVTNPSSPYSLSTPHASDAVAAAAAKDDVGAVATRKTSRCPSPMPSF